MRATFTHSFCLIPADYDNQTDDADQNGIDDSNRNSNDDDDENEIQQPATNSAGPSNIDSKVDDNITDGDATSDSSTKRINEPIDANEIGGSEAQPTERPTIVYDNRNHISISCDVNNGGCEQTCNMVPGENDDENVVECSCKEGFYLDSDGGKKCFGES